MELLVTGGAGFIGGRLVDALTRDHDVRVLDRAIPDHLPTDVTFIRGDVRDEATVAAATDGVDVVFHQAALVSVAQSVDRPRESHDHNVAGTLTVLDAARTHDARVVLASSAAIYGHPESQPIDESEQTTPTSPYGLEKLAVDHYARLYHELYGLETVALRYFNVYGPGQTGGDYAGVISVFLAQALAGEPITVHGDGEQTRDFVFVDDVVQANRLAATTDAVGEAFNVGTGETTTIRELADLVREYTDTESTIVHTEPREGDIRHSQADVSKARELLGYEPTVSFTDGLERTAEWFRERAETQS